MLRIAGKSKLPRGTKVNLSIAILLMMSFAAVVVGQIDARDPGPRGGTVDAGQPLAGIDQVPGMTDFFNNSLGQFKEVEDVTLTSPGNGGLGPRFNSNSCASCHSQPAVGGTSPASDAFPFIGQNPQTLVYNFQGAANTLPSFITPDGPAREVRFKYFLNRDGSKSNNPDGGVHDLFVISGRSDAGNCSIKQPNFEHNLAIDNVIFRIPTPVFGAGLLENIDDSTILANQASNSGVKQALGISGQVNRNGNDGTISRFGWKAQNKSLGIFAGEAYNVEMGITNELFPTERPSPGETLPANCKLNLTPEDTVNFSSSSPSGIPSDIEDFTIFMRLLAPPKPSTSVPGGAPSIARGSQTFANVGCAYCHTPTLTTGQSDFLPALSNAPVHAFTDLLVHHMGENLADGVSQGGAGPDQFRTAPLWGLGQRVFFLHDGRTKDLLDAIRQHASPGSEANAVIARFHTLTEQQKQDLLNFLRSL
jgi:CxxC motif-containing protein (DUF1111 family)